MADSNFVTTPDGRTISYTQWKLELIAQQEEVLKNVNTLIIADATNAVSVGAGLGQQEYGALLRQVVPNLLDQYGNINSVAAIQYYDTIRNEWATNVADKAVGEYTAQFADNYNLEARTNSVVNYAMQIRAKEGHTASVEAMNNALTRQVAMYHRKTIVFNSAMDNSVSKIQRVVQPNACEFCKLMAIGSTNGLVRTSTYTVKFHDHCHCTIQPIFSGEEYVTPSYYGDFEAEYVQASIGGGTAKGILANWRKNTK